MTGAAVTADFLDCPVPVSNSSRGGLWRSCRMRSKTSKIGTAFGSGGATCAPAGPADVATRAHANSIARTCALPPMTRLDRETALLVEESESQAAVPFLRRGIAPPTQAPPFLERAQRPPVVKPPLSRHREFLLPAQVAFFRLDGGVPEKELDLIEGPARQRAVPRILRKVAGRVRWRGGMPAQPRSRGCPWWRVSPRPHFPPG
jgi:hypothetical protein